MKAQAAQLQARATSEPITKRRQKEPKTEGERSEAESAGYAVLQKKRGNGDVDSCERRCRHERAFLPATLQWVIGNR